MCSFQNQVFAFINQGRFGLGISSPEQEYHITFYLGNLTNNGIGKCFPPPVLVRSRLSCPNSAGNLFTAAKIGHLSLLPQGQPERWSRVVAMVETMEEYFGSCTNHGECESACPKNISIDFIAMMNRDYMKAQFKNFAKIGQ